MVFMFDKSYVASCSWGKDSTAMVLRLIAENRPLTHVLFYDTGMEFKAIYNVMEMCRPLIEDYGAQIVVLKPENDFLFDMLLRPVNKGKSNEHYGYDWCGGICRWRTTGKITTINNYLSTLGDYVQYVGIAVDEPERIVYENNKIYPLVEWKMTEKDCLEYCYREGINWLENEVDLYQILDRVSCWCCSNKNIKELQSIYEYLPNYWDLLKALQTRIDRPFRRSGKEQTIFDLEERFKKEKYRKVAI